MKYTDAQLVSMTQQYTKTLQGEYICHLAYAEINRQIKEDGRLWNKCMDCGNPYPLDKIGSTDTFCCLLCEKLTEQYMFEGIADY